MLPQAQKNRVWELILDLARERLLQALITVTLESGGPRPHYREELEQEIGASK